MANPEHLAILKQGVAVWNEWRKENPEIPPYLSDADLSDADIRGANLSGAGLIRANLSWADIKGADLSVADLSGANLSDADLIDADLSGADFYNASFAMTQLRDLDLSGAKNLDTIEHSYPSSIGVDTIYKSKGKIPEAFLRGCGVPEDLIKLIPSLLSQPFQFYSCFISYSSRDEEFARRLHADLQAAGVRVWFAPEDLKIGDKIRDRIDESIRIHDKLLLILSENSIDSQWVEKEVETAFEKERRKPGDTVLFPIRLDAAVMETDQAWAADIRRTRHIGDFSKWKDHDAYKAAFDRLMRDLKGAAAREAAS